MPEDSSKVIGASCCLCEALQLDHQKKKYIYIYINIPLVSHFLNSNLLLLFTCLRPNTLRRYNHHEYSGGKS